MKDFFEEIFDGYALDDLRADYSVFFQEEASDIWQLMYRCHSYIWLFLIFVLFFVLSMFVFILVDAYSNMRYIKSAPSLFFRYMVLQWEGVTHIPQIEFIWTTLPCFFLLAIGYRSIYTLYLIDTPMNVNVLAKAMGRQWFWQYEIVENYPRLSAIYIDNPDAGIFRRTRPTKLDFSQTYFFDSYMRVDDTVWSEIGVTPMHDSYQRNLSVDNMMSLVVDYPVRFLTTGMDVLHSFALPSLGIKLDAVPGRLNSCDVVLERAGIYYGQCSELCGQGHGFMPIGLYIAKKS